MSATAEMAAPEAELSPPRQITGAQLMRRMKSSWEVKVRLFNTAAVPPDGERCLRVVADLVASAPGSEAFRFGDGLIPAGLESAVALRRGLVGPLEDIRATLAALEAQKLIARDETTVRLVLPPEPPLRRTVTVTAEDGSVVELRDGQGGGSKMGRPRKGETAAEARARWLREQQQRPLPLPYTVVGHGRERMPREPGQDGIGPQSASYRPSESRTFMPEGTFRKSDFLDAGAAEKSGFPTEPDFPKVDFPGSTDSKAVVVETLPVDQMTQESTPPTTTSARVGDFPGKVGKSAEDFFSSDFSFLAGAPEADRSAPGAAMAIAGEVIRRLGMKTSAAAEVQPFVLEELRAGTPVGLLVEEFAAGFALHAQGKPIHSIRWFAPRIAKAKTAWRARAAPSHPGFAEAPLDRAPLRNPFAELERRLRERAPAQLPTIEGETDDSG